MIDISITRHHATPQYKQFFFITRASAYYIYWWLRVFADSLC